MEAGEFYQTICGNFQTCSGEEEKSPRNRGASHTEHFFQKDRRPYGLPLIYGENQL